MLMSKLTYMNAHASKYVLLLQTIFLIIDEVSKVLMLTDDKYT
jgi:hypothetical protein